MMSRRLTLSTIDRLIPMMQNLQVHKDESVVLRTLQEQGDAKHCNLYQMYYSHGETPRGWNAAVLKE
jgi:hypothetical protein